ncbi:RNA ligase 2 [Moumouvirus australiensis]|uniref:RNA ligase 2 n=1 Tax=Moumouvirus australiensis TaxID=2109587 RepID=A0A2P1EL87_9VIRU|nr:RNA ligase 2 [Moumouvirus australiensis]AVL94635.1 RNA ligase 2 [Moumouvirus australiensis]
MELAKNFQKFFSIENPKKRIVKTFIKNNFTDNKNEWVVLEKIHGANFSFITDGENIYAAKRTAIISPGEYFFNYEIIVEKYKADILEIYKKINSDFPNIMSIQIFGELFGGLYPNYNYEDVKPVQKGIYYNPNVDFMVFDIKINFTTNDFQIRNDKSEFLSHDEVLFYLSSTNFKHVPIITKDNFNNIINLDPVFFTKVPNIYGLPHVDNNYAEGYIFKLNTRHSCDVVRPILKSKNNTLFGEIHDQKEKFLVNCSSSFNIFVEEIKNYLTKNRYDGIIGKIGPDNKIPKIIGCFIADALKDYESSLDYEKTTYYKKSRKNIFNDLTIFINQNEEIMSWIKLTLESISKVNQ